MILELGIRNSEFGIPAHPPSPGTETGTETGTEVTVGAIRRMES